MRHNSSLSHIDNTISQTQLITLIAADYIMPESLLRESLAIMPADANQLQIRLGTTDSSQGGFSTLNPGDLPLLLPLHYYGDLIRREFVITGTVGDKFIYVETLREPLG